MLVEDKWKEAWQPVQGTDAKGGFVRHLELPQLGDAEWQCRFDETRTLRGRSCPESLSLIHI